ncbi:flagellar assembly protein FliH [Anaeromyxobacter sp. K]|uniref:FliH/SctL family protein n=1 Tax=Anaeromyxobacter sp. (strain K) TaxID=447217 RepID=UPI00017BE19D|nr:FliH/SctL family protein [Anaeromyxobacter sp. K]ACG73690.1 flagellar assembly protein FliH [Anaeromyxobacter sp. K]
MTGTPRPPAFLAAHTAAPSMRAAPFAVAATAAAPAAARPAEPRAAPPAEPPPPPAPEAPAVEALRAEALERVAHAVEVLRLQAGRLAEQARTDALEVGFQVARRILEAEVSTSPEALFALVRAALRKAGGSRRVTVRLHPDDVPRVAPAAAAEAAGLSAGAIEIAGDASLERGDCVVDTDFGRVDGRLRTRLEELHRAAQAAAEEEVA